MRPQGQARFTGHHGAASMVREAIDKEQLIPNEVNIPKWNPISIIFVVSLCELALVAGFYLAWRAGR